MAVVAGEERDEANQELGDVVNAYLLYPIEQRILVFLGNVEVAVIQVYLLFLL